MVEMCRNLWLCRQYSLVCIISASSFSSGKKVSRHTINFLSVCVFLSVWMFDFLSVCLFSLLLPGGCLSVCLSPCMPVSGCLFKSVCFSLSGSTCLSLFSLCLSVCMSVSVSVYLCLSVYRPDSIKKTQAIMFWRACTLFSVEKRFALIPSGFRGVTRSP